MSHFASYDKKITNINDAAPLGSARTKIAAIHDSIIPQFGRRRLRRRGPRSSFANLKRKYSIGGSPSDASPSKSGDLASDIPVSPQPSFVIICINIRCLLKNLAELICHVEFLRPQLILLQETWLDASVESISLPNYHVVSRRDRSDIANRGGIIAFCRDDVKHVVEWSISVDAERIWLLVHTDLGSIAIGNWYKSPSADDDHITSFRTELSTLQSEVIGTIVAGDMNIHHSKWLRFSNANTPQGALLKDICDDFD